MNTTTTKIATAKVDLYAYVVCPGCEGQIAVENASVWGSLADVLACNDCGEQVRRPAYPFKKVRKAR